jgi:hypothetical protein
MKLHCDLANGNLFGGRQGYASPFGKSPKALDSMKDWRSLIFLIRGFITYKLLFVFQVKGATSEKKK